MLLFKHHEESDRIKSTAKSIYKNDKIHEIAFTAKNIDLRMKINSWGPWMDGKLIYGYHELYGSIINQRNFFVRLLFFSSVDTYRLR